MLYLVRRLREAVALWASSTSAAPIPPRTVLISSERLAHAFRRDLARAASWRPLLVGTRFLRPMDLAREVLLREGAFEPDGAETVVPIALEALFAGPALEGKLSYFDLGELRKGSGYAQAVASTLDHLADAGLDAKTLRAGAGSAPDPVSRGRCLDLAAILETLRVPLLRRHEVLRRAAGKDLRPLGPTFAFLESPPESSVVDFLSAIPNISAAYLVANPPRQETVHLTEALGKRLGGLAKHPDDPAPDGREISLVHRYLLGKPEESGDEKRPQSAGPDGTVTLELSSGAAEELQATADWVSDEVKRKSPLEEVAVLIPSSDPYAGMVYDALARLPWQGKEPPLHVASGLPVKDLQSGQRMIALLDALESGLRVEEFCRVLPYLRLEGGGGEEPRTHITLADARTIVWNCGTLGGSPERPELGAAWVAGLEARVAHLQEVASLKDVSERRSREVESAERDLEPARAVLPAVRDLAALLATLTKGTLSLEETWGAIRAFWTKRVVAFDQSGMLTALDEALRPLYELARKGRPALLLVRREVDSLRRQVGRFGEPRIFIGTPEQAAGIPFRAVRMVGLAEGAVAGAPAEDPLLPDQDRSRLSPVLRLASGDPLLSLQAFHRAVTHASERLSLSAPRQTVDGTVREASALFLEVASALRRPHAATGKRGEKMLGMEAIRRDYFDPGRDARRDLLAIRPARLETKDVEAFLSKVTATAPGPLDGVLLEHAPKPGVYSPSAIQTFLECPHRYLLERVLHWKAPEELPGVHELDALTYGSLFHEVFEVFFKKHGDPFYEHRKTLDEWLKEARITAETRFDLLARFYPLAEGEVRGRERDRLGDDIERGIRHEWDRGTGIRAVRIEEPFGYKDPVEIAGLLVRGEIDRVDLEKAGSTVRDFKSGKPKARKAGEPPNPVIDIQVAAYSLAVRELAKAWGVAPPTSAAYVYAASRYRPERRFEGAEFDDLLLRGREWLGLVARMIKDGVYPRTPDKKNCEYCTFKTLCGPKAPAAVSLKFAGGASGPVTEYIQLKVVSPGKSPAAAGAKKGKGGGRGK